MFFVSFVLNYRVDLAFGSGRSLRGLLYAEFILGCNERLETGRSCVGMYVALTLKSVS